MPRRQNRRFNIRQKLTLWDTMIYFFNNHLSETVTRQQLLTHLYGNGFNRGTTIDTYRRYLEKAGYMRKISRGKYLIVESIPIYLSINDAKQQAYGQINRENRISFGTDRDEDLSSSLIKAMKELEIGGFSKSDVWDTRKEYKQEQEDFLLESEFQV